MRSLIQILGVCALVVMSGSLSAEVYRWTDENGKIHFGDRPPANSKAEALDMPKSKSVTRPAVSDSERKQRQRKLVEALEEERRIKEQKKQEAREKAEKHKAYCKRLLAQVKDSERINRYYKYNEKGERVFMSDDAADRYRSELRSTYNTKCGNS